MFIKSIKKSNKGSDKVYIYHRLIEAYRTENGSRHRNILNLGSLDLPKEQWKILADRIEQIVLGQNPLFNIDEDVENLAQHYANVIISKNIKLYDPNFTATKSDFRTVDINTLKSSVARSIGGEYISYSMMNKLGLIDIFKEIGFSDDDIKYAVISIVGRLIKPTSENATYFWAKKLTALDELLNDDFSHISRNKMYEIINKLISNQNIIEKKLRYNERDLFNLKEKIILYDLTNTYFEGDCEQNPKAKHCRSKEKRNDRPLLTLGLVIDETGFPKRSKIMEGNVSEPYTLLGMIKGLIGEEEIANEKPTILIDAGISTEDNLKLLKELGYHYVCVARNHPLSKEDLSNCQLETVKEDSKNSVKVKLFKSETEHILYCQSYLKGKKEEAMKTMYETRFEEGIKKIESSIHKERGKKSYINIIERIGRLKEKYSPIARFYDIKIEKNEKEIVTKLEWERKNEEVKDSLFSGTYFIRSSRKDLNESELWKLYTVLTNVEHSFRTLKSDLNMRPIYHQKGERCDGHIFITLLAYHVLHSVLKTLEMSGMTYSWERLRTVMSSMQRVTTSFKSKDDKQIYVRNTTPAEEEQHKILKALKLRLDPIGAKKVEFEIKKE